MKKPEKTCIAFYNLENLFDTEDDPNTLDNDFTAKGYKNWNEKRYTKKLHKLSKVIAHIGKDSTAAAPAKSQRRGTKPKPLCLTPAEKEGR